MTVTDTPPLSPAGNPMGFGRMLRKEDARFLRGKGNYVDDRQPARHAARRGPAQPVRARPHRLDRHVRRRGASEGRAVITGKVLETLKLAWMPTLSMDVQSVLVHRQGPLPGPGGGVRRRRGPLLRSRRARS